MDVQVKLEGVDDFLKKLEGLAPDLKKKALKNSVGKGASVIRKSATKHAAKRTGAMAKNIRVQFASRTTKRTGDVTFRVGVRGGAQQPGAKTRFSRSKKGKKSEVGAQGTTWYWRLIEFGTQKMQAKPFMRPAMADSADKVFSTISEGLDAAITKYASKGSSE